MSALDDLLAARASAGAAAAPASAAGATPLPTASGPADLDGMLAARAQGRVTPAAAAAPSRSALGQVEDFLSAGVHHVANLPWAIGQLASNVVAAPFRLAPNNPVSRAVIDFANDNNSIVSDRESKYQASTPNSAGAYLGATAGELAPLVVGGIPKALDTAGTYVGNKVASVLPQAAQKIGAKLASGATQGAIVSAAQPVDTSTSLSDLVLGQEAPGYWQQKARSVAMGAALGGAVPAAAAVGRGAVQGVKNLAAPVVAPATVVAPSLEALLTRDGQIPTQDVINTLRSNNTLVQGSKPTTAQVLASALDGGNPQAVMAEKTVSNTPAGKIAFANLDNTNNAARVSSLKSLAGTDEDMAAAIQARKDATQPFIEKALADPATNPDVLKTSAPIRAGLITDHIDRLAGTSFGTDPVIAKTLKAIRQQVLDAADKTDVNAYTYTPSQLRALKDEPYVRPDLLDGIRQNLRSTISDNASNGAVSSKQEAGLAPLADRISSAIDDANPGYRDYLATYARASQPINSMEAARGILEHVAGDSRGANSAGDAQVTLTRLGSALGRATKSSPYELDPTTQAALEAIQSDLQRASTSNSIRAGSGSDTAFNLQAPGWLAGKVYGSDMTGPSKAAKALAGALGAVGGSVVPHVGTAAGGFAGWQAASKVATLGQERTAALLAKALADPQTAADLPTQAQRAKTALPPPGSSARIPQINLLLGQALGQRNP